MKTFIIKYKINHFHMQMKENGMILEHSEQPIKVNLDILYHNHVQLHNQTSTFNFSEETTSGEVSTKHDKHHNGILSIHLSK